ncbi:unnamed protein product [Schistosoma margrebowiei]|uniref:Uncharacterized protein n=1 Tax=Schistosoma margrebowiei TaxID=48269 RepID=A0A183MH27_9TREM|nr:unnamed protein product [Schistosoma margrebowiei]
MVVDGSRQKTLDPGFVLLGTRPQGVIVILREIVLPDGFAPVSPSFTVRDVTTELMVIGGSRQETLDRGFVLLATRHQGVLVILRELVLPGGFDPVSPSFTVRDVTGCHIAK